MPNVRATANPSNPDETAEVGGVTVDQFTSINVDRDAIKAALKDGAAITVLDDATFDADEQKAQVEAAELFRAQRAGEAPVIPETAAAEAADTETHAASQRRQSTRQA